MDDIIDAPLPDGELMMHYSERKGVVSSLGGGMVVRGACEVTKSREMQGCVWYSRCHCHVCFLSDDIIDAAHSGREHVTPCSDHEGVVCLCERQRGALTGDENLEV